MALVKYISKDAVWNFFATILTSSFDDVHKRLKTTIVCHFYVELQEIQSIFSENPALYKSFFFFSILMTSE